MITGKLFKFTTLTILSVSFCSLAFADINILKSIVTDTVTKSLQIKATVSPQQADTKSLPDSKSLKPEEAKKPEPCEMVKKPKSYAEAIKLCKGVAKVRTTKKVIAITFDDGPHQKYTEEILDILELYDIKATFFVVGKNAANYPELIRKIDREGHALGSHGFSHFALTTLTNDEIETELVKTNKIIYNIIGKKSVFFRPPYGVCSNRTTELVSNLGFTTIVWSIISNDYDVARTTPKRISDDIIKGAEPGAIILLHDGGGNREKTVAALPSIIRALKAKGYEFLTIPELLQINTSSD